MSRNPGAASETKADTDTPLLTDLIPHYGSGDVKHVTKPKLPQTSFYPVYPGINIKGQPIDRKATSASLEVDKKALFSRDGMGVPLGLMTRDEDEESFERASISHLDSKARGLLPQEQREHVEQAVDLQFVEQSIVGSSLQSHHPECKTETTESAATIWFDGYQINTTAAGGANREESELAVDIANAVMQEMVIKLRTQQIWHSSSENRSEVELLAQKFFAELNRRLLQKQREGQLKEGSTLQIATYAVYKDLDGHARVFILSLGNILHFQQTRDNPDAGLYKVGQSHCIVTPTFGLPVSGAELETLTPHYRFNLIAPNPQMKLHAVTEGTHRYIPYIASPTREEFKIPNQPVRQVTHYSGPPNLNEHMGVDDLAKFLGRESDATHKSLQDKIQQLRDLTADDKQRMANRLMHVYELNRTIKTKIPDLKAQPQDLSAAHNEIRQLKSELKSARGFITFLELEYSLGTNGVDQIKNNVESDDLHIPDFSQITVMLKWYEKFREVINDPQKLSALERRIYTDNNILWTVSTVPNDATANKISELAFRQYSEQENIKRFLKELRSEINDENGPRDRGHGRQAWEDLYRPYEVFGIFCCACGNTPKGYRLLRDEIPDFNQIDSLDDARLNLIFQKVVLEILSPRAIHNNERRQQPTQDFYSHYINWSLKIISIYPNCVKKPDPMSDNDILKPNH